MAINIEELLYGLQNKDNKYAYQCLKQLQTESERSNAVYPYLDTLAEMLDDSNSYVRTRGIRLIAANAQWDVENKIDGLIGSYLKHIMDAKPITARQCIQALPVIAKYKPDLAGCICTALQSANPQIYASSMQPLIYNDIATALKKIKSIV